MSSLVSIIVPAWNAEQTLAACLESILAQTWPNIEIIVVDDGSTDATEAICRRFSEVRYFRQDNAGVSVARNLGMDEARGEFIMFADADDMLTPEIVARLMTRMVRDTDIACCSCTAFSEDGLNVPHQFFPESQSFASPEERERLYLQLLDPHCGQPAGEKYTAIGVPWGKLYRAEFLRANALRFSPRLRRLQDNIFNMYAFSAARRVDYLNAPLYRYRVDHIRRAEVSPDTRYAILEERETFFAEHPGEVTPAMRQKLDSIERQYLLAGMKTIAKLPRARCKEEISRLCRLPIYARVLQNRAPARISMKRRLLFTLARCRMYGALTLCLRFVSNR